MLSAFRAFFFACLLLVSCAPEIGDKCQISTDCSSAGDRRCDPTQPGGYCTLFNCEPGGCPEEAVCVAFKRTVSAKEGCSSGDTRLQQTFCMLNCGRTSDCRSGYECLDLSQADNPIGAMVVERGSYSGKVCAVPASGPASVVMGTPEVCTGTDKPFVYPAAVNAGGSSGSPGAGSSGAGQSSRLPGAGSAGL